MNKINLDYMHNTKYLNDSNRAAFMEVANYVRFSYTKSERDAHIILSDILDHLIEAQKNGTHAADFFGNDYRLFAQEITAELPEENHNKLLYHFSFIFLLNLGTVIFMYGISDFIKLLATGTYFKVPMISLIISCFTFIISVELLTFFIIKSAKNNSAKTLKSKVIIYLLSFIMIVVPILFFILLPLGPAINFKYYYAIPLGFSLLVIAWYFYKKISR